jgi:hypothetical protein
LSYWGSYNSTRGDRVFCHFQAPDVESFRKSNGQHQVPFARAWQPVGLRMIRLQPWESGPYITDSSLNIPDMRVNIGKIFARSRWL